MWSMSRNTPGHSSVRAVYSKDCRLPSVSLIPSVPIVYRGLCDKCIIVLVWRHQRCLCATLTVASKCPVGKGIGRKPIYPKDCIVGRCKGLLRTVYTALHCTKCVKIWTTESREARSDLGLGKGRGVV